MSDFPIIASTRVAMSFQEVGSSRNTSGIEPAAGPSGSEKWFGPDAVLIRSNGASVEITSRRSTHYYAGGSNVYTLDATCTAGHTYGGILKYDVDNRGRTGLVAVLDRAQQSTDATTAAKLAVIVGKLAVCR